MKKLSEMTEQELRDYILENQSEMRTILDDAEAKGEDLNEEQQKRYSELEKELKLAEMRQIATMRSLPPFDVKEKKEEERKIYDIFGENLRSKVDAGGMVKIEVRANPINSVDVKDTVPVLFKDVVDALEPALIINKVGSRMLFNVQGTPTWPTIGDVEANWVGENVSLTETKINFGAIRANPRRLGVKIKVSKRALNQSNLELYNIVVGKIARSFAAAINKALVSFTKVATEAPTGVFVTPALTPVTLSASPTLKEVVALETAVLDANVGTDADGFGAYIIGTGMRGKLKTTPIEKGSPKMVLDGDTMNGYPVVTSNYMPVDSIGFGFFEYAVISQFGNMDFTFDPITGAGSFEVIFVGNTEFDITTLRPEAFVVGQIPAVEP